MSDTKQKGIHIEMTAERTCVRVDYIAKPNDRLPDHGTFIRLAGTPDACQRDQWRSDPRLPPNPESAKQIPRRGCLIVAVQDLGVSSVIWSK